jgi:membrane-bound lytic murein transglycosylase A
LRPGVWAALLAAAALSACVTAPPPSPTAETPPPTGLLPLTGLPGWAAEDYAAALAAVRLACAHSPSPTAGCRAAAAQDRPNEAAARALLEAHFRAKLVAGEGLLTGYFAPLYEARDRPDGEFAAAARPRPADPDAAGDRATIERQPAEGALAWMRPEDLFFLQIQGSGVLTFEDGRRARAVFAGSNGLPFVAISGPMAARALLGRDTSAGAVHAWLAAHRGPQADAVMALDARYIFFRLEAKDIGEPKGAAGAPLIAGRSVAIDASAHPYFELLWLDAEAPNLPGARPAYRRLAVALDTGAAIRGEARADLYVGSGPDAGEEAGRIRHALRLYRIVPAP